MPTKKFQKRVEDFICQNCGIKVTGTGYTNHCPKCLYSKHVDINPGDRLNSCQGTMKPINIETKDGEFVVIHKCERCGEEKRNKANPEDKLFF
ncbi:MAG: RNHCP domain-containing protein [Candidatus Magasanikbacteria bacterium]|nr:RNHCP domain-containing protein [Candidatus Magasanikbacteria bacterium]